MYAIGALSPGMESTVPLSRKFYTGGESAFHELALTALTWVQATNTHDAEAATAAHIGYLPAAAAALR